MIKKIILLIIVMMVLSYLGQTLAAKIYAFQGESFTESLQLIRENFGHVLVSNVLLYFLDMFRLNLIGAALKIKFSFKDAFGAIALNLLFGWISPMAILGAPAMAYYLHKRGYSVMESLTVAFVRSFSIILVSALTTIAIYGFNLQGQVANIVLQEKIFQVLIGIALYIFSLIVLSFVPLPFFKNIKMLNKVTLQIRLFLREGKLLMVPVLILTLILNFLLVSFIPYVSFNFYPEIVPLFSQTLQFLSYMLLMPTPGASGLAEVGAPMFFQKVPLNEIISAVTAMRISTIGLQTIVGVCFIIFGMKGRFSFEEIQKFKKSS